MFEKDHLRREKFETLERKALERKLLEAGQTIVKERCKCTTDLEEGKVPGAGWMPFSLSMNAGGSSAPKKSTFSFGTSGSASSSE